MKVWVQIGIFGVMRIFKNRKAAMSHTSFYGKVEEMDRAIAVGQIRNRLYDRQNGICARCPNLITRKQMHMHEKIHRGQGGEISMENSEGLCYQCHLGARGAHPEKQLMFTRRKL